MKIYKTIIRLFCILVMLILPTAIFAGIIGIDSGFVNIPATERITSLKLHNDNDNDKRLPVQINCVKWTQENGKDVYTPTNDLMVTPPIFSIPANGLQIVRIGLIKPHDLMQEMTYKLQIKQIAQKSKKNNIIQVVVQFNVPVIVKPAIIQKDVKFSLKKIVDNQAIVEIINKGNVHFTFNNIKIIDKNTKEEIVKIVNKDFNGCLLAKQTTEITVPLDIKISTKDKKNNPLTLDQFNVEIT